jgi:TolB-like protein
MVEPPSAQAPQSAAIAADHAGPPASVWERLKHHKVLQWTLTYAAAAYTLLHATQMAAESFDWPHLIVRIVALVLVLGLPIVVLLAWYHGHKAQQRFSTAELSLLTVLLIIAGSILWAMTRTSVTHTTAPTTGLSAPRTSIAVLPFVNLTGDASKDYLGDGMAEEVIHTLARVPGFKVPARTSSFAYKGRNVDVRQIARDLGVGAILEGSVRSAGERIRITVELIDAQDGLHIWSDSYNQQFTDIFKLQDEISSAIVQALQGTVNSSAAPVAAQGPGTHDPDAYRLYLQARAAYNATEEGLHRAMALYDQAVARDPHFAQALAWRSETLGGAIRLGFPYPNALEKSEEDARRALALDSSLPEAHLALGQIAALRNRWVEAETNYRAAANVQPPDARVLAFHATALLATGRLRQAHTLVAEAYRLAPADSVIVRDNAIVESRMGLDSSAIRFADLAVALGMPSSAIYLPQVYINAAVRSGRYEEAAARVAEGMPPALSEAGGAEAFKLGYLAMGDPKKVPAAREALQRLVRDGWDRIDPQSRGFVVALFTRLGAVDEAYALANRTLDDFNVGLWTALWVPEARAFRTDSRFQAFVTRLQLIDYWKQYGPPDDCDLHGETLVCR